MTDTRPTDLGPPPGGAANPLAARVKAILLQPKAEWPVIDGERQTIADIYKGYAVPLAAIGPLAGLIGGQLFGYGAFGIVFRPPLGAAIGGAVISYLLALAGLYVLALIIDALAPRFGAAPNRTQAFKVAAYSATAGWIAGVFQLIPSLSWLALLGLYGLYLIYLGLPVLMKAPAEKAGGYLGAVIVAAIVIFLLIGVVAGALTRAFLPTPGFGPVAASGTLRVGGGEVDLGALAAAGKKMEATANGNGSPALAPDVLAGLLPGALPGGLARTSIESASGGAAGLGGSTAEARYGAGDTAIRLKLTDLGAAGAIAALGSAFNVQSSKQTATAYERVTTVDGRMTSEKYDSSSHSGSFSTLVGNRVMVEAEGSAPSADALKGAVAAIDLGRLEGLVKS